MLLLSLVGEQPIPNLLASKALQPAHDVLCYTATTLRVGEHLAAMLLSAALKPITDYDLGRAMGEIDALCDADTVINLTGGTKVMALAAYEVARRRSLPFVYLQSQDEAAVLYHYVFEDGRPVQVRAERLQALVTIDEYLQAHGLSPKAEKGPQNAQESGLRRWLEKHVDECRSNMEFEAFEVDFILRRANQVALLEAKMTQKNTRAGIDQLNTAAGRAFLGTYTKKILVVSHPLGPQLSRLAEARQIKVVVVDGKINQQTGRLDLAMQSQSSLLKALEKTLGSQPSSI